MWSCTMFTKCLFAATSAIQHCTYWVLQFKHEGECRTLPFNSDMTRFKKRSRWHLIGRIFTLLTLSILIWKNLSLYTEVVLFMLISHISFQLPAPAGMEPARASWGTGSLPTMPDYLDALGCAAQKLLPSLRSNVLTELPKRAEMGRW